MGRIGKVFKNQEVNFINLKIKTIKTTSVRETVLKFKIMKKHFGNLVLLLVLCVSLTSCYTQTYSVGSGAQTGVKIKEKNHYLIGGLAPLKTSNPIKMAGDAKNYDVTTTHSFVDLLINLLTGGLYTPTTTIVKK